MKATASLVLLLFAPGLLHAQTGRVLVDFGAQGSQTVSSGGTSWNDVHPGNVTQPGVLVEDTGSTSGIQLAFDPLQLTTTASSSGVTLPTPGSPLAGLAWPATATGDALVGFSDAPSLEFSLTGLDPSATYDLTFLGSRLSVSDTRTASYEVAGLLEAKGILDASNNSAEIVRVAGIAPDENQEITVHIRPARDNDTSNGYFYLNALAIDVYAGGTQPPLVAFTSNLLDFSRVEGNGAFGLAASLYTNDASDPNVTLTAVDDATLGPPLWLDFPASSNASAPLSVTVDGDSVGLGLYSATLTAQSPGYTDATTEVTLFVRPQGGPLNLLFYGNSYSQYNGGVPDLVGFVAEEAGWPAPKAIPRMVAGRSTGFHLNDPDQAAAITEALPFGEYWDCVIIQGQSEEATSTLGDPATFIANTVNIVGNVRAHSAGARAILLQTWARAIGHPYYAGGLPTFASPLAMHQEIATHYAQAVDAIEAQFGPGTAERAAAGDAVALLAFASGIYDPDLSHPGPKLTLSASMTVYSAIYERLACAIAPDFGGSSNLVIRMGLLGLGPAVWYTQAGIADRVAEADVRRFPGSGEDYLLRTGPQGAVSSCSSKSYGPGEPISLELSTPLGTYDGNPSMLFFQLFPTGSPPAPQPATPELHFDPAAAVVLFSTPALEGAHSASWAAPPTLAGISVLVQGQVLAPSAKTGNPFTVTDAHELVSEGRPRTRWRNDSGLPTVSGSASKSTGTHSAGDR